MNTFVLYIIIFIIAAFLYYIFDIEPKQLKIEKCVLHEGKDILKLVQLSDLHLGYLKIKLEKINKVIEMEKPDVISITGDLIDREDDLVNLDNFLTSLECDCPVFITLGNHDYNVLKTLEDIEEFEKLLSKFHNIKLLHNKSVRITKEGRDFDIIGLADTQSDHYSKEISNSIISSVHGTKIVITHNPDAACDIEPNSCHCIITGHLHGGQIWLPLNIEFSVLRKDSLPKQGYKQGLYVILGNRLYISRGIGTSLIPARFLSKPEITVFHL